MAELLIHFSVNYSEIHSLQGFIIVNKNTPGMRSPGGSRSNEKSFTISHYGVKERINYEYCYLATCTHIIRL